MQQFEDYLQFNIATSKQIQASCDLTARQVATRIKNLGDKIIKIKNGRSPKYALTKNAFGVGDSIYIWQVDDFGKHSCIANLRPLACGGFFVEKYTGMPSVFLGEAGNGLYDDLPYFLYDMAPSGFLGKKIAEQLHQLDNNFPKHLHQWNNEHIGRYLLANTDNNIGNLKFGNSANLNIGNSIVEHSRSDYLSIADDIISSNNTISSAGGEQQKFTTFTREIQAHTIVKFSPKDRSMGDNENAQRWRDILLTEYYANLIINTYGITTAAQTEIIEDGGRLFLESKRLDRIDKKGRKSMLSLKMIDSEFCGIGNDWLKSATTLYEKKLLAYQGLCDVEKLAIFATLINNTDTHLGNISFEVKDNIFNLLPIYDMCSMGFAPQSNGEITPFTFETPNIKTIYITDEWLKYIKKAVNEFWQLLTKDERVSMEFNNFIQNEILK